MRDPKGKQRFLNWLEQLIFGTARVDAPPSPPHAGAGRAPLASPATTTPSSHKVESAAMISTVASDAEFSNLIQTGDQEAAIRYFKQHHLALSPSYCDPIKAYTHLFWAHRQNMKELQTLLSSAPFFGKYVASKEYSGTALWSTKEGLSTLLSIVEHNDLPAFNVVLAAGTFPSLKLVGTSADKLVLTSYMASIGRLEMLKALVTRNHEQVEAGSTLESHNSTPLIAAARNGQRDTVSYLVEEGAKIEFVDAHGESAINAAERMGHSEIADFLTTAANKSATIKLG